MDVLEQHVVTDQAVRARVDEATVDVHERGTVLARLHGNDRVEHGWCPEAQRIEVARPGVAVARRFVLADAFGILRRFIGHFRGTRRIALEAGEHRERRLVALVADERADEHRHARLGVPPEQPVEVRGKLLFAATKQRGVERDGPVARDPRHQRVVAGGDRHVRPSSREPDQPGDQLEQAPLAHGQIGAGQLRRARHAQRRAGTEHAEIFVVAHVDDDGVRLLREDLVRKVVERVRIHGGQRRRDHFDPSRRERALEALVEDAGQRRPEAVREAGRARLALHEHPEGPGCLRSAEIRRLDADGRRLGGIHEQPQDGARVRLQVVGLLRARDEQRLEVAAEPGHAQSRLGKPEQCEGRQHEQRAECPQAAS